MKKKNENIEVKDIVAETAEATETVVAEEVSSPAVEEVENVTANNEAVSAEAEEVCEALDKAAASEDEYDYGDEDEDIAYLWQNRYNRAHAYVDLNLAIFVRQKDETYVRIGESQRQYAHSAQRITELLEAVGYTDVCVFADKKLQAPSPHELRWFIAARKPQQDDELPTMGRRMTEL